jgi:solute carrier family 35 protein F1/2
MSDSKDQVTVETAASSSLPKDSAVVVQSSSAVQTENENEPTPADKVDEEKKGFLAFFKTKEFYIILFLGYVLHSRSKK